VTANGYGIPPIPPINEVKPIGNKKICPVCSSDNKSSDTKCTNCGKSLAGVRSRLVPPKPSEPGKQTGQNEHQVVNKGAPIRTHVPGLPVAAQVVPQKTITPQVKPIKPNRKLISDDEVSVTDEGHLSNVETSAEGLGL
jgi:hypothetical protein